MPYNVSESKNRMKETSHREHYKPKYWLPVHLFWVLNVKYLDNGTAICELENGVCVCGGGGGGGCKLQLHRQDTQAKVGNCKQVNLLTG